MTTFPPLQAYVHSDVAALLPQRTKDLIESKAEQAKANFNKWKLSAGNQKSNYWPIAVAIGGLFCLSGVFLSLAAHQILPHGANVISSAGIWGQVAGYGALGVGFITALVGAVMYYKNQQVIRDHEPDVSNTHYLAESAEMNAYFPSRLKANELVAVDHPGRKEITIYYQQWFGRHKVVVPMQSEVFEYETKPREAYQKWLSTHSEIVKNKKFITLDKLRQRIEDFESKKREESQSTSITQKQSVKSAFATENLPQINSKIALSCGLELKIDKDTLFIHGSDKSFGAFTENEACTRELAFLLQKNSVLVEQVVTGGNTQEALNSLADAIRKELSLDGIAGVCVVDSQKRTYFVEI